MMDGGRGQKSIIGAKDGEYKQTVRYQSSSRVVLTVYLTYPNRMLSSKDKWKKKNE